MVGLGLHILAQVLVALFAVTFKGNNEIALEVNVDIAVCPDLCFCEQVM